MWYTREGFELVCVVFVKKKPAYLFDGATLNSFDLHFGVPQGSCLGPLLFVLYASRLFEIIEAHLPEAYRLADDTHLYLSFKPDNATDQAEAVRAMENCIDELRKWIFQDRLKINDIRLNF